MKLDQVSLWNMEPIEYLGLPTFENIPTISLQPGSNGVNAAIGPDHSERKDHAAL